MEKVVIENIENIRQLCKSLQVKELFIFGSASTGDLRQDSDIDFLISFQNIPADEYTDNYFIMHSKLETYLDRKIDLLTTNSLSNPYFIQSIEKTKKLLYAA